MNETTQRIVQILRNAEGAVSGECIRQTLGLSRAAVWKHIQSLREYGYRIDAASRRGYRFRAAPNLPLPAEIAPRLGKTCLAYNMAFRESVDSTNREAVVQADKGRPEGTVIIADQQTGGRGRMERTWFSPPGKNLYLSIILRPDVPPAAGPGISLVAALAGVRSISAVCPALSPRIKWPNDIYLQQAKVAGILCDMKSEVDRIHYLVLGVGMNVNITADEFPVDIRDRATSLRSHLSQDIDRSALAAAFLVALDTLYAVWLDRGVHPLLGELMERSVLLGRRVSISGPRGPLRGIALRFADDGALILRLDDGKEQKIVSGDVHVSAW
ncbi:MAG: biotin--[acetyl-CoA-carboxylase] ligase [Candidatus Pacebacteria bacterium]|nr:biotin--[acetyl-CoA-carboxylase] ligase [Candidatus Paceibacterota bacterium]